jgi:hypothetical protein
MRDEAIPPATSEFLLRFATRQTRFVRLGENFTAGDLDRRAGLTGSGFANTTYARRA